MEARARDGSGVDRGKFLWGSSRDSPSEFRATTLVGRTSPMDHPVPESGATGGKQPWSIGWVSDVWPGG